MLTSRMDRWVRVGAGCGLLLLIVAQQKLCPWLVTVPAERDERVADAACAKSAGDEEGARKESTPRLPYLTPGTSAPLPRWPGLWDQTKIRHTLGHRDGVVSCGPAEGGVLDDVAPAATVAYGWLSLGARRPLPLHPTRVRQTVLLAVVFEGTIQRTGPPLV